ncbi:hypothetical protein PCASD_16454 [Puccinia coronata f. sp. avenae]|uniref:Uncharacterized protein n=1 Tax=Puccinia coronata f. sp. avenae TaxID=200324 RepID=A0A2N5U3L3_9BASI|nr:hypothetical protein PCASD_16454 [Puccinia coronata f. sp. avenae]
MGQQSWPAWKELIKQQFGTRPWEKKMRRAFENDYFDPVKHNPHQWCLTAGINRSNTASQAVLNSRVDRGRRHCPTKREPTGDRFVRRPAGPVQPSRN